MEWAMRLTGSSQGPGWALSRFIEAGTFLLPPLLHHYHHPLTMTTKQKIKKKKKSQRSDTFSLLIPKPRTHRSPQREKASWMLQLLGQRPDEGSDQDQPASRSIFNNIIIKIDTTT